MCPAPVAGVPIQQKHGLQGGNITHFDWEIVSSLEAVIHSLFELPVTSQPPKQNVEDRADYLIRGISGGRE